MATQDATDAGANFMLNALGTTITPATTTIYVGLSSTPPTRAGANITEPGGDYQRPAVTFGVAASRKRTNTNVANFVNGGGNATTGQGIFTHATFFTTQTGGTCHAFTLLSQQLSWQAGLPVTMAIGDISLEFEIS